MERKNPNKQKKYKEIKRYVDYDRGITNIGDVKKSKVVILTEGQAATLNNQSNNSGTSYELVEDLKKTQGRPKKETIKTEE